MSNLEHLPVFGASCEGGLGPRKNGGRGGGVVSNSERLLVFRAPREGGLGPRSTVHAKKILEKGTGDRATDIATL